LLVDEVPVICTGADVGYLASAKKRRANTEADPLRPVRRWAHLRSEHMERK